MLNQAMHQILKTQVLEIVVQEVHQTQELLTHKMQKIAQTALVTQLEIATNF